MSRYEEGFSGIDTFCQYAKMDFRASKEFINGIFLAIKKA
jgi:hypothetical protein